MKFILSTPWRHCYRWILVVILCAHTLNAESKPPPVFTLEEGVTLQLFVPRGSPPALVSAAHDAAEVLETLTGADVTVQPEPWWGLPRGIYLGQTRVGRTQSPLPVHEGRIWTDGEALIITGGEAESTAHTLYWWLREEGGVRWYFPGDLGTVYPARRVWSIAAGERRYQPAYERRSWFGLRNAEERLWARRNGFGRGIPHNHSFHHFLGHEEYDADPTLFSLRYGQRQAPTRHLSFQPNYLHPELIPRTVDYLQERSQRRPRDLALPVAPQDNFHFGEFPEGTPHVPEQRYYDRFLDWTDFVYAFLNETAAAVREAGLTKPIGTLAYRPYKNAPSFPVDEQLAVFVCEDRFQYFDPAFAARDRANLVAWGQSGAGILGLRDYYYGQGYVFPRLFPAMQHETLAFAHAQGFRHFYTELNPIWGFDAAKAWRNARLLENPTQGEAAAMNRFYVDLYGPAAETMQTLEAFAASAWQTPARQGFMFGFLFDSHQAIIIDPAEAAQLRALTAQAMAEAETATQKARIALWQKPLETGLRIVAYRRALWALRDVPDAAFLDAVRDLLAERTRLEAELAILAKDPLNRNLGALFGQMDYVFPDDPMSLRLWQRAQAGDGEAALLLREVWATVTAAFVAQTYHFGSENTLRAAREGENQLQDPSFELPFVVRSPWGLAGPAGEGQRIKVSGENAAMGRQAVLWENTLPATQLTQRFAVEPGAVYVAEAKVQGTVSVRTTASLLIHWLDADGQELARTAADRLPPGDYPEWVSLGIAAVAPPGAVEGYVALPFVTRETGVRLWLDDVYVRCFSPVPPEDDSGFDVGAVSARLP